MQLKTKLCATTLVCVQLFLPANLEAASYGSAAWGEAKNRIQLKTVCVNHSYGSINSRNCRAKVSKYFNKQCKSYTKKYSSAPTKTRAKYKNGKNKFCYAARHFKIIE